MQPAAIPHVDRPETVDKGMIALTWPGTERAVISRNGSGRRCGLNAGERQHQIVALARRTGEVDVAKLSAELSVSAETIRRDPRS
jgi:hypothetical protein